MQCVLNDKNMKKKNPFISRFENLRHIVSSNASPAVLPFKLLDYLFLLCLVFVLVNIINQPQTNCACLLKSADVFILDSV